jgi:hypothetical protein
MRQRETLKTRRFVAVYLRGGRGAMDYVCGYKLGYDLEVDIRNTTLLVEEYHEGKLTQSGTPTFTGPVRSRSDSVSFAKNESESRKSARTKS